MILKVSLQTSSNRGPARTVNYSVLYLAELKFDRRINNKFPSETYYNVWKSLPVVLCYVFIVFLNSGKLFCAVFLSAETRSQRLDPSSKQSTSKTWPLKTRLKLKHTLTYLPVCKEGKK